MKIMPVGEFKRHFSEVIESVKRGEEVVISYGKKKKNIAVLIPYAEYKQQNILKLGLLEGKGHYAFNDDYKMTIEELIGY